MRTRSPGRQVVISLALGTFVSLLGSATANANGGTIQVSKERAGPYAVTVLTNPSPIQVGRIDVSVLVEGTDGTLVQDANVMVTAMPVGASDAGQSYEATHDRATNKLFYAADVPISRAGPWGIDVTIMGSAGVGTVGFEIEASEPAIAGRIPLLVLMAILAALTVAAGVSRYRSRRRQRSTTG